MWTLWQESNNSTFNGVMFNWNSLKSFLLRSLYDWTNFLGSLHCKFLFIFPHSLKIERWTSGNTRKDRIQLLKNWGGPYRLKDEGESLEIVGHVQMRVINALVRGWVDSSGGNEKNSRITKNTIIEVVKKEMSIEEVTKSTTLAKKNTCSRPWLVYCGSMTLVRLVCLIRLLCIVSCFLLFRSIVCCLTLSFTYTYSNILFYVGYWNAHDIVDGKT